MPEPKYLVFVDSKANHNKFYKLNITDGKIKVEYGRVGCNKIRTDEYPIEKYDWLLNSKLRKGYVDQTHLVKELIKEDSKGNKSTLTDISSVSVRDIVNRLQKFAKQHVAENYTISSQAVTQAMVDEAQKILDELVTIKRKDDFNDKLEVLFSVIPRKMTKVADYLASSPKQFGDIISREQDTLDTMKSQVVQNAATKDDAKDDTPKGQTILDRLGLEISEASDEDIEHIKNHLGRTLSPKFKRAWRVVNKKTQAKFDKFCKDNAITNKKMYWHGSRNENWWSILQTGLVLHPTSAIRTGAMWGKGLYFANRARKSYGYTSGTGSYWARGNSSTAFMAVMDVAEGKAFVTKHHSSTYYDYTWNILQKNHPGCHSLFAEGGVDLVNDEIIVYKQEQCTIHYLVELNG